ncbi:hypothetical protein ASF06_09270 [Agreia sp. Leaf244]|uniref:hypothetical protein n=1 Tax=Agreia sp. Leaf244 TaxID=1736305 RepID=UPI0006FC365C|nr:hypothetical protein [Agreia sp. Leaf244]KQO10348.1 hypothetical protein ASF06_09270 [Agreia sp. Leaf244]
MSGRHGKKGTTNKVLIAIIGGVAIAAVGLVIAFAADAFWGAMIGLAGVALAGAAARIRTDRRNRAAETAHGPGSLIQQRMRINRSRNSGLLFLAAGVLFPALEVILFIVNPSRPLRLYAIFPAVLFVTIGITQLVLAANERRRFENEFGREAGKQQPVEH